MNLNDQFDLGVNEMMLNAQARANELGKSIRVGNYWVNPSSASLAKRHKDISQNFFSAESEARNNSLKPNTNK